MDMNISLQDYKQVVQEVNARHNLRLQVQVPNARKNSGTTRNATRTNARRTNATRTNAKPKSPGMFQRFWRRS